MNGPRLRFWLKVVPRVLIRRPALAEMDKLAPQLEARNSPHLARWCRERLYAATPFNFGRFNGLLELLFRQGRFEQADQLLRQHHKTNGLEPGNLVDAAARFARAGRFEPALRYFLQLIESGGSDLARRSPSPLADRHPQPDAVTAALDAAVFGESTDSATDLPRALGQLCFSFGQFEAACHLFESAGNLTLADRVAWYYSATRAAQRPEIPLLCDEQPDLSGLSAEWAGLLATAHFLNGNREPGLRALTHAVHTGYSGHPGLQAIAEDFCSIAESWLELGGAIQFSTRLSPVENQDDAGLPKRMICGFGWTGSGAIHDALSKVDFFCEFPAADPDPYLHPDALSELAFVQEPAGLGRIWRQARNKGGVETRTLWDLLRLHVLGIGGIGYTEHKSTNAARTLVRRFGSRYTSVFRRFALQLAQLASDPAGPGIDRLLKLLRETTESLCRMVAEQSGKPCILFNNAIAARNVDMLDLFSNLRAVAIWRDPRDVYADRKQDDLRHWRTAGRFGVFYEHSVRRFLQYLNEPGTLHARNIRLTKFETFVQDQDARLELLRWFAPDNYPIVSTGTFDPDKSKKNIGIGKSTLAPDEYAALSKCADRVESTLAQSGMPR